MNTMPQTFDAQPITRAGFSVSGPAAPRRAPAGHLRLVETVLVDAPAKNAPAAAGAAAPYDLSARRHLARVPERQPTPSRAQAAGAGADNPASSSPRARLEPLVFALVLLVSVAALAVALRAG